jgi:hypothetical protein
MTITDELIQESAERAVVKWHSDSGHGWLVVCSVEQPLALKFASTYSFIDSKNDLVYLEEDCDAPAYLDFFDLAWMVRGIQSEYVEDRSRIRSLPRGKAKELPVRD